MSHANTGRTVRIWALAFGLLATGILPWGATANHLTDDRNRNGVHLVVLVHHPYPDLKGDPWGIPYTEGNRTGDWLALRYGAYWFPTAVVDGVTKLERTPQGEGAGPNLETYANYKRAYADRVTRDTPFVVRIEPGPADAHQLRVNVTVQSDAPIPAPELYLRIALFEDDVYLDGGNGVTNHRFVVRTPTNSTLLPPNFDRVAVQTAFPHNASWNPNRLGIVAYLQNEQDDSARLAFHEVLQAAVWRPAQEGPTVQADKAVLLELYSATWCAACVFGDNAVDELANEFGLPSSTLSDRRFTYLSLPTAANVALALVGGALIAAGLRSTSSRPPKEGSP